MSDTRKIGLIVVVAILGTVMVLLVARFNKRRMIALKGAVITRDTDPRKQLPIAGVDITADNGLAVAKSQSDSSGLFNIAWRKRILRGQVVTLRFRKPDYEPLDLNINVADKASDKTFIAALAPVTRQTIIDDDRPQQTISNPLVRYSIKT